MADDISVLGIKVDSREVVRAEKALDKLAKQSTKTERATDALGTSTKRASDGLTKESRAATSATAAVRRNTAAAVSNTRATDGMQRAIRGAGAALLAFIGMRGARALKDLADEATNVQNRLRQVTSSVGELNAVFSELVDLSLRTRTTLTSTSILFQRLTLASDDLGLSQREILSLTETINKSFAISGATATETSGAIRQLSQGLAAGALRGDEFNSVAEQAPAIMKAIADQTKLTRGELREFAATGGITAEILILALQNAREEIEGRFATAVITFSARMGNIRTGLVAWAAEQEDLTVTIEATATVMEEVASVGTGLLDVVLKIIRGWIELTTAAGELITELLRMTGAWDDLNRPIGEYLNFNNLVLESIGLVNKALLTLVEILVVPVATAFFAVGNVIVGAKNQLLEYAASALDAVRQGTDLAASLREMKMEVVPLTVRVAALMAEFDAGRASIGFVVDDMTQLIVETKGVVKEMTAAEKAARKLAAVNAKLAKATAVVVAEIQDELDALQRTDREQAIYVALTEAGAFGNIEFTASITAAVDALFDERDALEAATQAAKDLEKATTKAAREQEKAFQRSFKFTADLIQDAIEDWKGFADTVVDVFKSMLARMVAEIAASKVLQFFGIVGGSAGFAGAAGASTGGGGAAGASTGVGLVNVLSAGKTAFDFLTGGGIGVGINTAIVDGFQFVAGALESAGLDAAALATTGLEGGLAGLGGGSVALGTLVSIGAGILGAFVGTKLGESIFGKEAQSSLGATIGAVVGSFISVGLGTAIGAAIGGALDALFGSRAKTPQGIFQTGIQAVRRPTDRTIRGRDAAGITSSPFGDVTFSSTQDLFRSQKQVDEFFAGLDSLAALETALASTLSEDVIKGIASELDKVERLVTKKGTGLVEFFSDRFGIIFDGIGGNVDALFDRFTEGLTDQEFLESIGQIVMPLAVISAATGDLATVFDSLAETTADLSDLSTESEHTLETWVRLGTQLVVANALLDNVGAALFTLDEAGTRAAETLVTLFGGAEFFITDLATFNDLFVETRTASEQLADSMGAVFDDLELTLPATRDGFRDLVLGLDLTTQSSAEAFAVLVKLSGAADQYYTNLATLEAERQARELQAAADRVTAATAATDTALTAVGAAVAAEKTALQADFDADIAAIRRRSGGPVRAGGNTRVIDDLIRSIDQLLASGAGGGTAAATRAARDAARREVLAAVGSPRGADLSGAFGTLGTRSEALFGTLVEFQRDTALTKNALQSLRDAAVSDKSVQEQMIAAINRASASAQAGVERAIAQRTKEFEGELAVLDATLATAQAEVDAVRGVGTAVLTLAGAINALAQALGAERAATSSAPERRLTLGGPPPSFAHGGRHAGGLRLVGERGPELETTGPSRITSNSDLAALLNNDELRAELRALREEVRRGNFAIAKNTLGSKKIMERWDGDGLPEERATL